MPVDDAQFLGWDGPALAGAIEPLRRCGEGVDDWDMSRLLVVVPAARAGRRLLERLVHAAGRAALLPPTILTPSDLPEQLYRPPMRVASPLRSGLTRVAVLRQADPDLVQVVAPHRPSPGDYSGWWALAEQFDQLAGELAAFCMTVAEVPGQCARRGIDLRGSERWAALAQLEAAYHAALQSWGLCDLQWARREAIAQGSCRFDRPIVLLATPDLTPMLAAMLRMLEVPITALIHAPEEHRDGFDDLGALVPGYWQHQAVEVAPAELRFVDSSSDQARAVVEAIARRGSGVDGAIGYAADQITVGLGDSGAASAVRRELEFADLPVRYAAGRPFGRSRPAIFLASLARFADGCDGGPRFDDLAELLRHPDVERYVDADASPAGAEARLAWLELLDRYANDHLQGRLSDRWLGDADRRARMKGLYNQLMALLAGQSKPGAVRPLGEWSEPIAAALRRLYGAMTLDRHDRDDDQLIRALQPIAAALREQAELDPRHSDTPRVTFAQAINLTLRRLAAQAVPEPAGEAAIELTGFLELALDDAPMLVLTGVNEGCIPTSHNADAFLPDHLRAGLGLNDNARRYARDLLLLAAAVHSREAVTLIAARRSVQGDPLAPSRLLLACDSRTLLARINQFYHEPAAAPRQLLGPGERDRFLLPPPLVAERVIDTLAVTAFRDYLACPYRFYLKRVLKLRRMDDAAVEMDGAVFGSLIHAVLRGFGQSEVAGSADAAAIYTYVRQALEEEAVGKFGAVLRPAVRVQLEQARSRLEVFARQQAVLAERGWEIRYAEVELDATIEVDGLPFTISGMIDRIDEHPKKGLRILDYKTSDHGRTPRQTHRAAASEFAWGDLQLPLYRVLAGELGLTGPMALGYFNLPRKKTKGREKDESAVAEADWSDDELADAMNVRDTVIRRLREQRFWPPAEAIAYADGLDRLCQDEAINRKAIIAASRDGGQR